MPAAGADNRTQARADTETVAILDVILDVIRRIARQIHRLRALYFIFHRAEDRIDYPAVGDWVLVSETGDLERVIIAGILPRKSSIERIRPGSQVDRQIIATNVDIMLIATSVNEDMNSNRLDRYITLAIESGVRPIVLLTKADLIEDAAAAERKISLRHPRVEVRSVSMLKPESRLALSEILGAGLTSVIVGSSGVGKSTFVNSLLGEERAKTSAIREGDGRGRHTTTSRNLFVLPTGGLLIDTPGMRELQLGADDDAVGDAFADIEALVVLCRFTDCGHESEPGCRIRAAIEIGDLTLERWKSYGKLVREIRHQQLKDEKKLSRSKNRVPRT